MLHRILLDTGPLVALLAENDSAHDQCAEQLHSIALPFLSTWPVLTEAAWLLRSHPEALQHMFLWIHSRKLTLLTLGDESIPWLATFYRRYRNREPQLADASLVYVAERDNLDTIFTLDQEDFSVYRFGRNRRFKILPN